LKHSVESLDYIVVAVSTGLFFVVAPKDASVLKHRVGYNGPSRSSKVVGFCTNRKRVCDFLLVINSNLGHILPLFREIVGFLMRKANRPLFHPNFGVFPVD